jgi:hypothetical protein
VRSGSIILNLFLPISSEIAGNYAEEATDEPAYHFLEITLCTSSIIENCVVINENDARH